MSTQLNWQQASMIAKDLAKGVTWSGRRRSFRASAPNAAGRARLAHEAQAIR
jgi:hypothetical protein